MIIRRHTLIVNSYKASNPTLSIQCADEVESTSVTVVALYNNAVLQSGAVWSITQGSQYATIDNLGEITISQYASSSSVTVSCSYNGLTATKELLLTYKSGSESQTETEVTVDPATGDVIITTTTTTENEDGSTESTTTSYNENGTPISTVNNVTDTDGNVSTQDIIYDEDGNEVVTGYSIDTSDNPDGTKTFNGDGVNTEYYAFDMTRGFVIDFNFTINFNQQPPGQNENHHNILTMKRSAPSPWYGFQLRQTGTNKYLILGTQFSTGNNTNTQINTTPSGVNPGEFNFRITYDPTASSNTFVCRNMMTNNVVYTSNDVFPDIPLTQVITLTAQRHSMATVLTRNTMRLM